MYLLHEGEFSSSGRRGIANNTVGAHPGTPKYGHMTSPSRPHKTSLLQTTPRPHLEWGSSTWYRVPPGEFYGSNWEVITSCD